MYQGGQQSVIELRLEDSSNRYKLLIVHKTNWTYNQYMHLKTQRTFFLLDLLTLNPIKCYLPQKLMDLTENASITLQIFRPRSESDTEELQAFAVIKNLNTPEHLALIDLSSGSFCRINLEELKIKFHAKSHKHKFQFSLKHLQNFYCFRNSKGQQIATLTFLHRNKSDLDRDNYLSIISIKLEGIFAHEASAETLLVGRAVECPKSVKIRNLLSIDMYSKLEIFGGKHQEVVYRQDFRHEIV